MAILKNISTALSRGSLSQSSRAKLSPQESKKRSDEGLSEAQKSSLMELKSRLFNTLIKLCGGDKRLTGMVKTLVTPILSSLTRAQIEEGASFIHGEIEALANAGLIELGAIENRQKRQGDSDRGNGVRQDIVGEISG
jgi:hypothetical protein